MMRNSAARLEYCGMSGSGDGLRAAKADAARKLARLVDDVGAPKVLAYGGHVAIVSRMVDGWAYAIVWADRIVGVNETSFSGRYGCSGFHTAEEAGRGARRHLAQVVGVDGSDGLLEPADVREQRSYLAWQARATAFRNTHPELGEGWRSAFDAAELGR